MSDAIKKDTDWKDVAMALGQRINFVMRNCNLEGEILLNQDDATMISVREYLAQGIEMIPGIRVDREILATFDMPMAKRKKAQEKIMAARRAKSEVE
jgi:hypothetical protein